MAYSQFTFDQVKNDLGIEIIDQLTITFQQEILYVHNPHLNTRR